MKGRTKAALAAGALALAGAGTAIVMSPDDAGAQQTRAARGAAVASASTTTDVAAAMRAGIPVRRETLGNGLRVVLSEDHSVPTIAIAVYYDVGSRQEVRGRSGFAHLFEHMMFEGSANVDKGEHFALITQRGGSLNGTTSEDRTNYYETLPANELALGLWLEADRMRSLAITEENFENQRSTVMDERRQSYENQPYALSFLRMNELAYGDYWPYSHSTIGDTQDLVNAPLTAVQEFWMQYYPPNNAVLSIAGDIDPEETMRLVHQYFDSIQPREVPPYQPQEFAPQTAERRDTIYDAHAELPAFHVGWHIPPNRDPDHYALEMLAVALGSGDSSRLYRTLVREREICSDFSVSTDDRRGPDLFGAFAVLQEGHTGDEARAVIYQEIERVAREGLPARELERVKNRIRSFFLLGLQSGLDRARTLGEYELYYGDANLLHGELERYLAVSSEDIQRVAGRYFTDTNRTVLDVIPQPEAEAAGGGAQ